jgi:hypothetical protein
VSEMFERSSAKSGLTRNVVARAVFTAAAVFSCLALAPQARAQSVLVTVSSSPPGLQIVVDGQTFSQTQTFTWAVGTGHSLAVGSPIQPYAGAPEVYTFQDWTYGNTTVPTTETWVTAMAGVTQYTASFIVSFPLTVSITNNCGTVSCGGAPGVILLNGNQMGSLGPQWYPAGTPEVLTAVPNIGYAFAGWTAGADQAISGVTDTVTLTQGVTAIANFTKATSITFATQPEGLKLVIDTEPTSAPNTESLGWGTVHNIAAVSPQQDLTGNYWVFSSWSDGGAVNHPYTVPLSSNPVTLTATYTPASLNTFLTQPPGLNLTVDGRSNWNTWYFAWAVGSTHTFSAPATQTDSQGRLWSFTGWSNGGPAAQTVTVASTQGNTYTATFQQLGQLTVNSTLPSLSVSVNGTSCTTPCTVQPPLGTQVTISAPASVPAGVGSRQQLAGMVHRSRTRQPDHRGARQCHHGNRQLSVDEPTGDGHQPRQRRPPGTCSRPRRTDTTTPARGQHQPEPVAGLSIPQLERRPERYRAVRHGRDEPAALGDGPAFDGSLPAHWRGDQRRRTHSLQCRGSRFGDFDFRL